MLENLKKIINRDTEFTSALEEAAHQVVVEDSDDIRSAFLDNAEAQMIGVENDPEIKKLVDKIPPIDGDVSSMDVKQMLEEYVPVDESECSSVKEEDTIEDEYYDDEFIIESTDDDFVIESADDNDSVIESTEDHEDEDLVIESFDEDDDFVIESCDDHDEIDTDFDSIFDPKVDDDDLDLCDRDDLSDAHDNIVEGFEFLDDDFE